MRLRDRAVFASFLAGSNGLALVAAQQLAAARGDALLYLHGGESTGKSHLLQAVCAAVPGAAYFPLAQLRELGPGVLENVAQLPVIALDDLDAVAGDPQWERQLFGVYNDCLARDTRVVIAAPVPASDLAVGLPDLRSRLAAMPHFGMRPLDEAQQREALRLRAAQRGIELPDDTVQYLQRRFARDMARLHELLDRLDLASLQEQRRVTVPFIREVLDRDT
jgi:DnaA family protein